MPLATVYDEIEAQVSFRTYKTDYGVDRSPVWDEIDEDTMELESLHMFGSEWSRAELVECFGKQGANALEQLIFNGIEDWEDD